jgi:CheY-like chemotaxis protein
MPDSTASDPAPESAQYDVSHGLLNFCTGPGFSVMGLRDIGRRGSLIGVRGCVLLPSRGVCTAKPMKALRVLVVEDDALIGLLLGELLAGMGHKVCAIAATEADAVSAAIRYRPDLIVVDAGLGRGSGISAIDEILRAGSLAHVFISGDADMVRAHRPEAVILKKPFWKAELVKAIEVALDAVAG